ncbi:hypothetical protein [Polyangium sp. 15x6]|uniref:hypothetical protein n=1 Tax=Polyangium sp. 15x6 TaxID=3042687 RepID=UPI00249AC9D5|nr:hypothetical protein [Polyangium sp. 15x6]MDI3282751.1 hypothetical protein [Polyangium sp. 15x6]
MQGYTERGPALLVDERRHARKVPVWGQTKGETPGDTKHMTLRAVVIEGRIVGVWEYEPRSSRR